MDRRGLEILPEWIRKSPPSIQGGYDAVMHLANAEFDFTAIAACGDTLAVGAIKALQDLGRRVPEEVAVTGFDDIDLSRLYTPTLTTVRQPKRQLGIKSMEKLLERIAGNKLTGMQEILGYELVIRESTGEFIG